MSLISINRTGAGKWRALLAGLALLAFVPVSPGQVAVQTVGGGVRRECGPSSGFVAGNTWSVAQFGVPRATALDSQGDLWVADTSFSAVEDVTLAGNRTSSVTYHPSGTFPNVVGVAVDSANNLYVLTTTTLMKFFDVTGSFPNLNFLLNVPLSEFASGSATAITVGNDIGTNIYISFTNSSGGSIVRIPQPFTGASVTMVANYAFAPAGLSLRQDGLLAVTDSRNDAIYTVATGAGSTPLWITGGPGAGFVNGPPSLNGVRIAKFNQPRGIAASGDGRMVVCDTANNYLRIIDTANNTTSLYGTASNVWPALCCACNPALYPGWVDGPAGTTSTSATGRQPVSVTISPNGTLFVTELYYSLIRTVSGSGLTPVISTNSGSSSTNTPTVYTQAANPVSANGATLNAVVVPNGSPATVYFQWGSTTNYGNITTSTNLATNLGGSNTVSMTLAGLQPNTVTHFQAVAYNSGGTTYGTDFSFITPDLGPAAVTLPASNITSSSAILNATVNPEGVTSSYYFEWGLTTNYGNSTAPLILSSNLQSSQTVSALVSSLVPGSNYHFQVVAGNGAGTNFGGDLTFITPFVPPTISISPSNGYFPECQTITVTSTVTNVYYTEDGTTPTTNSTPVANFILTTNGLYVGTFQWCNSSMDLSALRMIAVNAGVQSQVLSGTAPSMNQLGFVRSPSAGIGSTAFIPIVLDLQSNREVQSLQFRVEVTPIAPNTNMISSLSLLSVTSNDFVQLVGASPGNAPITFSIMPYAASSNGQGLAIYTQGTGTGLDIQNFGVVGLLEFQIPRSASINQAYLLNIINPSGTSGGFTNAVPMTAMPAQTLVVADVPYLAGDATPATGYDAGEFGNGNLDNSDFNAAFYASMGVRVPPFFSDAFNAMDVWPQTPARNGDNKIDFQDWNHILLRSLGLDTNNWYRSWTNNGVLFGVPTAEGLPSDPFNFNTAGQQSPPGLVWQCQASVGAGTLTNLSPGQSCSLPVYANILPGCSLAGFQFRAIVSPNGNAPAVGQLQFNPAFGIPSPLSQPGLSANDILQGWEIGAFAQPLQNSNYLGCLTFVIPSTAQAGQSYVVHFIGVSGAPDDNTDYTMESFPGYAWVLSSALHQPSITSDEWKVNFFGSLTNPLAADNVDADGDGALNWQEYLAGTDPTNALSAFKFSSAAFSTGGVNGVALNWPTAPGKTYILESIPAMGGKNWTPICTNIGDGYNFQFIQTKYNGNAQFYRIQLQP